MAIYTGVITNISLTKGVWAQGSGLFSLAAGLRIIQRHNGVPSNWTILLYSNHQQIENWLLLDHLMSNDHQACRPVEMYMWVLWRNVLHQERPASDSFFCFWFLFIYFYTSKRGCNKKELFLILSTLYQAEIGSSRKLSFSPNSFSGIHQKKIWEKQIGKSW